MIADSHCHLDYPNLYNELDDVVNRAIKNDVKLREIVFIILLRL